MFTRYPRAPGNLPTAPSLCTPASAWLRVPGGAGQFWGVLATPGSGLGALPGVGERAPGGVVVVVLGPWCLRFLGLAVGSRRPGVWQQAGGPGRAVWTCGKWFRPRELPLLAGAPWGSLSRFSESARPARSPGLGAGGPGCGAQHCPQAAPAVCSSASRAASLGSALHL